MKTKGWREGWFFLAECLGFIKIYSVPYRHHSSEVWRFSEEFICGLTVVTEAAVITLAVISGHLSTPIHSAQRTSLCQGHPTPPIGTILKSPAVSPFLLPMDYRCKARRWQGRNGQRLQDGGTQRSLCPWLPSRLEQRARRCTRAGVGLQGAASWPAECQPSRPRLEHGTALPAACGQKPGNDSEIPGEHPKPIGKGLLLGRQFYQMAIGNHQTLKSSTRIAQTWACFTGVHWKALNSSSRNAAEGKEVREGYWKGAGSLSVCFWNQRRHKESQAESKKTQVDVIGCNLTGNTEHFLKSHPVFLIFSRAPRTQDRHLLGSKEKRVKFILFCKA